jgi:hypothetical protein
MGEGCIVLVRIPSRKRQHGVTSCRRRVNIQIDLKE